jgi:flagellar biosynthesis protein FlhF
MQIKRYTGPTLPDVLAQIDRELGPNALIIHTRPIRMGGFFGVLGQQGYEVTVAIDYNFRPREEPVPRTPSVEERVRPRPFVADPSTAARPAAPVPPPAVQPMAPAVSAPPSARVRDAEAQMAARRELSEMRVRPRGTAQAAGEPARLMSDDMERMHRLLVKNQVEEYLSRRLLKTFDEQLSLLGEDWNRSGPRFEQFVAGMIRTVPGIKLREGRKPVVAAFVGPTGVGKTTTIAKIAGHFSLMEHRRVGIITSDTFRIAATDQIRRYGEIIGVPVRVVETPEDLQQALLQFNGYDLVLLDTAGRSPQNKEQIIHLKQLMDAARPDEVHLVVSMTTKYIDVLSIVAKFGVVPTSRVILTKFDETRTYGLALNLSVNFGMDIAYMTAGQSVPDDLEAADATRIARLIVGGATADRPGGQA